MQANSPLTVGFPAPLFRLTDLSGQVLALKDLLGLPVLVNFWSAECPWAARCDSYLVGLQDRLTILTIASNANEPVELIRQAAEARGLQRVLLDPAQEAADLYSAITTPHLFLIDSGGLLCYQGAVDDVTFRRREPTRFYLQEALDALCAGQPVPVPETTPYGCTIVHGYSEK
jgi:peroxiredoxin